MVLKVTTVLVHSIARISSSVKISGDRLSTLIYPVFDDSISVKIRSPLYLDRHQMHLLENLALLFVH